MVSTFGLVDNLWECLLDLFFPLHCVSCNASGSLLCSKCQAKCQLVSVQHCPICSNASAFGVTHTKCKRTLGPDRLISGYLYASPLRELLHLVKYRGHRYSIKLLEGLFLKALINIPLPFPQDCVIIPVPLHADRKSLRGFNQAEELALVLAETKLLGKPQPLMQRIKKTPSLATLPHNERHSAVSGSFKINPDGKSKVYDKTVVIVDDVWTTGSTAKEMTKVLKRNGAKEVWVVTLARG